MTKHNDMSHEAKLDLDYLWDAFLDSFYRPDCSRRFLSVAEYREGVNELKRLAMEAHK